MTSQNFATPTDCEGGEKYLPIQDDNHLRSPSAFLLQMLLLVQMISGKTAISHANAKINVM